MYPNDIGTNEVKCHMKLLSPTILLAFFCRTERYTSPSKEAGLVIYLAFLAKMANLYYMILTAFKKFWQDTVAKFISGTQDRFIYIKRQK